MKRRNNETWGERIMDNLMDRVAERISAQEMIKANAAAEAAETERLRTQVMQHQQEMDEIREKANELSDILQEMRTFLEKKTNENSLNISEERIKQMIQVMTNQAKDIKALSNITTTVLTKFESLVEGVNSCSEKDDAIFEKIDDFEQKTENVSLKFEDIALKLRDVSLKIEDKSQIEDMNRKVGDFSAKTDDICLGIAEIKSNSSELFSKIDDFSSKQTELSVKIEELKKGLSELVLQDMQKYLDEHFDKSDKQTHDIGVQVYRNVQSSIVEEQKKQSAELIDNIKKENDSLAGIIAEETSAELHGEIEKLSEDIKNQQELIDQLSRQVSKNKSSKGLNVIILIFVLAMFIIKVLELCQLL